MNTFKARAMDRRTFLAAGAFACLAGQAERLSAQVTPASAERWRPPTPTLGGKQLWADVWFFHQYRIQRNVLTGHHRLLDPNNRRLAWGTLDACQAKLAQIRSVKSLPPMTGSGVVVLHGLLRTRASMKPLCDYLRNQGGYSVFDVGYPTTRGSVAEHARSLDSVMQSLGGLSEVHFIGHSLGNIVIRYWLHEMTTNGQRADLRPRFGRMVMLAPPNQQPEMAVALIRGDLVKGIAGNAAVDLAEGWTELGPKLAVPPFEFGILAGGRGNDRGYNPVLEGDDDGVVTVESTRLTGAADFRRLDAIHALFMSAAPVRRMTLRFLREGSFEGERNRQPIV